MTISISGRCPRTGQLGIAISSSSIAVGQRCPWIEAEVGAVSSQNVTLPALGPAILRQLAAGENAEQALSCAMEQDPWRAYRQVTVLPVNGPAAVWNGDNTLGTWHAAEGKDCVAAGNMLHSTQVVDQAISAFEQSTGELAERLIRALAAAIDAGGEQGPVHSAAVKVYQQQCWPLTDLRIDWSDQPIEQLHMLWQQWQPQMQDYLTRALDPRQAPSYGVPGNE